MSAPFKPISTFPIDNVQFNPDVPHGPYPQHMDVRTLLGDGSALKLRVSTTGDILSDDLELGNRFLRDLNK